jgi:hypothetical protein
MNKHDTPKGDQYELDGTRRDLLALSIAVATFGAAMGVSASPAGAEGLFLKIDNIKGERTTTNKQLPNKAPAKHDSDYTIKIKNEPLSPKLNKASPK